MCNYINYYQLFLKNFSSITYAKNIETILYIAHT